MHVKQRREAVVRREVVRQWRVCRAICWSLELCICVVAESFVMLYSVMVIEQTSESADWRVGEMISNRLLATD